MAECPEPGCDHPHGYGGCSSWKCHPSPRPDDLAAVRADAAALVADLRGLHQRAAHPNDDKCWICHHPYPCPTVRLCDAADVLLADPAPEGREIREAAAALLASLPDHWHDEATERLREALAADPAPEGLSEEDVRTAVAALHAYASGDRLEANGVHKRMADDLHALAARLSASTGEPTDG